MSNSEMVSNENVAPEVEEKVVVELETDSDLPEGYLEKFGDTPVHLRDYAPLFEEFYRLYREEYPVYYNRSAMWEAFGNIVNMHIMEYTVPQYGDYPNDQVTKWDINTIMNSIGKYVNRFQTNARGEEENLLDLVKIAHYACMGYMKLRGYTELFLPVEESTIEEPAGEAPQMESSDTEEASVSA